MWTKTNVRQDSVQELFLMSEEDSNSDKRYSVLPHCYVIRASPSEPKMYEIVFKMEIIP